MHVLSEFFNVCKHLLNPYYIPYFIKQFKQIRVVSQQKERKQSRYKKVKSIMIKGKSIDKVTLWNKRFLTKKSPLCNTVTINVRRNNVIINKKVKYCSKRKLLKVFCWRWSSLSLFFSKEVLVIWLFSVEKIEFPVKVVSWSPYVSVLFAF